MSTFFNVVRTIIVLVLYLPVTYIAIMQGMKSIQSTIDYSRGTNAASRFVRDVRSHFNSKGAVLWGTTQAFVGLLCSFILGFKLTTLLMPVPGVLMIVASFVILNKMNKNKQRIKDARVMTKTGTKVVKAAGVGIACTAGAAATVATGGVAGVAIGAGVAAAGVGASRAVGKAGDMMTDVDAPDITEEDFSEFNKYGKSLAKAKGFDIDNMDQFVLDANKMGIEGNNVEEIGQNALKSPVMQTLLNEQNLEHTVDNVIPFVQRALQAAK